MIVPSLSSVEFQENGSKMSIGPIIEKIWEVVHTPKSEVVSLSSKVPFNNISWPLDLNEYANEPTRLLNLIMNDVEDKKLQGIVFDHQCIYSNALVGSKGPIIADLAETTPLGWDISADIVTKHDSQALARSLLFTGNYHGSYNFQILTNTLCNLIDNLIANGDAWSLLDLRKNLIEALGMMSEKGGNEESEFQSVGSSEEQILHSTATLLNFLGKKWHNTNKRISLSQWISEKKDQNPVLVLRGSPGFPQIHQFIKQQVFGYILELIARIQPHQVYILRSVYGENHFPACISWSRDS